MRPSVEEYDRLVEPSRHLRLARYHVPPNIRLDGDRIVWQLPGEQHNANSLRSFVAVGPFLETWQSVKPTRETFDRFLEIADPSTSDTVILRYAKRWGVLGLCVHLEPIGGAEHWDHWLAKGEPLSAWRRWSRILGAIVRINERHEEGRLGNKEDWETLWKDRWFVGRSKRWPPNLETIWKEMFAGYLGMQRAIIGGSVNSWLEIGTVRPLLEMDAKKMEFGLGLVGLGLFGALAVALLEETGGLIASCTGCRKFYRPTIRPKSGQDRYCPTCREAGIPVARAKYRQNLRRKTQKKKRTE